MPTIAPVRRFMSITNKLEAELLAVENRYANPSVANDYIQTYDEYERTIAYYNENCATDK